MECMSGGRRSAGNGIIGMHAATIARKSPAAAALRGKKLAACACTRTLSYAHTLEPTADADRELSRV